MGRGSTKGGRGGGRGGGRRMFVDNIEELQMREQAVAASKVARAERRGESDSEEEDDSVAAPAAAPVDDAERLAAIERMAEQRKAGATSKAVAGPGSDDEDTVFRMKKMGISKNPNAKSASGRTEFSVKGLASAEVVDQDSIMSRREREVLEAARKKEDYMKRRLAGETDDAKADLKRLAEVRARRAEQEKQRLAEGRGIGMTARGIDEESGDSSDSDSDTGGATKPSKSKSKAAVPVMSDLQSKKRAAALGVAEGAAIPAASAAAPAASGGDGPPKLKSIDIKKMNGDALKESLKERGLKFQGPKKELIQRLIDFEAARS